MLHAPLCPSSRFYYLGFEKTNVTMGNGSMKSKRFKRGDCAPSVGAKGCVHGRHPGAEALQARVEELERQARRRVEELSTKEQQIRALQEQLGRQTRAVEELGDQLQSKCLQLSQLQDVMRNQAGARGLCLGQEAQLRGLCLGKEDQLRGLCLGQEAQLRGSCLGQEAQLRGLCLGKEDQPSPLKAGRFSTNISGMIKDSLNRRSGAKAGVSAEPTSRTYDSTNLPKFSFEKARVPKDASVKKLLVEALLQNQYLCCLEPQQVRDMVECMYQSTYEQGHYVIRQGEPGNHLFVLADGKLDVFQHSKLLSSVALWTTFGELAILYNCTRTASVRAGSQVKVWALDREVFQNVMRMTAEKRHEQHRHFLRSVSLLANLPEDKLSKIVDCLEVEYYDKGEYVLREGEEGSTFYIIAKGTITVTQSTEQHKDPQTINTLQRGDYFGEKALISDDVRSANIIAEEDGVECLVIDRETFDLTVGTFNELQKHLHGYVATLDRDDKKRHAKRSACSSHPSPPLSPSLVQLKEPGSASLPPSVPLDSLEVVATLGVGGFGRVELVKVKNKDVTFALKVIKKKHVVENRQEEHIHSERSILAEASSPFIVKLYATFRDNKYVYMLLEACLGGEIWSLLRDRGSFDEATARFCVGCVTEAFDYLHRNRVLYRDLKPENLMLDADGYIKLVDFGFAKKIRCGQKTWTFCGTPEYVAPEIILNKGHSFSVDFWSLGILVFELLTGSPPFSGSDQMMTYTFILKGIEKMDFPKRVTKRPEDLIRKLCRRNPSERLGNLKNGIGDIKKHRWFNGFNWEGLKKRSLQSPLRRELQGPTDLSYFDSYPPDEDTPPDELSGWDMDF